jgi:peptidoglycan/xylan/chitin deacetylase (PgdA/CDA1 family)
MKVVQSWDDGVVDDIRLADLLRRHQASATFNLNPGLHHAGRSFSWRYGDKEVWRLGRDELVEIYAGFEIANHSLNHPNLLVPQRLDRIEPRRASGGKIAEDHPDCC